MSMRKNRIWVITPEEMFGMSMAQATTNITLGSGSNLYSLHKAAAAETITLTVPVKIPVTNPYGYYLNSIKANYFIGVADLTSYTWTLYKNTVSNLSAGTPSAPGHSTITTTDTGAVTHTASIGSAVVITPSSPLWIASSGSTPAGVDTYHLVGSFVCPSTTTLDIYSIEFNFDEVDSP